MALNFGRIKDKAIDAALTKIRTTAKKADRDQAAKDLNKAFGSGVHNLWTAGPSGSSWATRRSRTSGRVLPLPTAPRRHHDGSSHALVLTIWVK